MENMKINNKNIVNSYQPTPTLFYDIEGKVVEQKGKDIKIEKTINNKVVEYSLKLKEEIDAKIGEDVKIEKENISSVKAEEKEEIIQDEQEVRDTAEVLRELGLEYTEENIRMIEHLIKSGIPITKDSVDSYIKSKEYLNEIVENINPEAFVKLIQRGIDIEGESLQKIAEGLETIKNEKTPFSIKRFLRLEKDIDYKEAEAIAKEIYGQKMGKDVYDTIIALHKEKLPITKENIEKTTEVMAKIYNLKDIKDESYVEILNENQEFNINNLFKLKNSYTTKPIENNILSKTFEHFTVAKEATIESLKEILSNLNIEESVESISILREFIMKDMNMDRESYDKVISMKKGLKELTKIISHGKVGGLIYNEIDPTTEDIHELVAALKEENIQGKSIDIKRKEEILKDLETLGNIKDKDLLQLLKQGEDFNLKTIKEIINTNIEKELSIEYKTMEKSNHIGKIMNTLGENLNPQVISLASKRHEFITLENLSTSYEELKIVKEIITPVDEIRETLIFEEYLRTRNNLTTNMIKESIKDGRTIESMPLNELNLYIEKKINRYKESDRMTKEIKDIKGNYEKLLPMIMKNEIPMTLKEIRDINLFLNGEKGLTNLLKSMTEENKELKEEINLLQEKISGSIKDGSEEVKDDYKDLMNIINNSNKSFEDKGNNQRDKSKEEYMEISKKISKNDMVIKLPIDTGNGYRDLNIIVPDITKGIDKSNMKFLVSLETENLGQVAMDLKVVGKEVYINIEEQDGILQDKIILLKQSLEKIGYTLNVEVETKVS
jgi:hypothetical protein